MTPEPTTPAAPTQESSTEEPIAELEVEEASASSGPPNKRIRIEWPAQIHDDTSMEDQPQPIDPFLEAAMASGPEDAVQVIEALKDNGKYGLLLDRRIWQALAPSTQKGKSPPGWFPGSRAQYIGFLRVKEGKGSRCPLTIALHDVLTSNLVHETADVAWHEAVREMCEESLDSMHDASLHALSQEVGHGFTKQVSEHEKTRKMLSDLLDARFGKIPAADSGTAKDAREAIRRDQENAKENFKRRREAVQNLQQEEREAAKEAKAKAKAKATRAKGRASDA